MSGLDDNQSHVERLSRQLKIWKSLCMGKKDVICMGDANICASKWLDDNYKLKTLSEMIHTFMLESTVSQLVTENTRSEIIKGGGVSKSCIDHCYTNAPDKVSKPEVVSVGTSDHLGIVVKKYTKIQMRKPSTIMKRSYKQFDVEK